MDKEPAIRINYNLGVILFYNGLDVPTRQILDSKGVIPSKTAADAKIAIQEMVEYSQKWNNGTSSRTKNGDGNLIPFTTTGHRSVPYPSSAHAQSISIHLPQAINFSLCLLLSNNFPPLASRLGHPEGIKEEGKTLEEAYYTQFGAPYQPGGQYRVARPGFYQRNNGNSSQIIKVLQERGFGSLPSSTKTNPRDQVKSISTAKADFSGIRRIRCDPYAVSGSQHRSISSKIVLFPRRLLNFGCNDWREAQDVKILDAYDYTLPKKEKDPWSFTLPCFIHNICFDKALVDLGASVSVMPFSTYINLSLGILYHIRLTIELADRTIKQPRGIAKNVLVRIEKFIFPIDFIILDIPEDEDVPLILRRPFLSTANSKIDVFKRKITLRVGEEKLVFKSIKPTTSIIKRVFVIESLDSKMEHIGEGDEPFDPTYGFTIIDDDDMTKYVMLGMIFCKKYASCQRIMKKFALGNNCERIIEEE
ncbi:putative reverse transcriptase domain-containing protein [Tanacetum coccineum]